jgi:Putative amidase domain
MKKRIAIVVFSMLSLQTPGVGVASASPLGYTYNRAAAVAYAHQWSCNGTTDCRNDAYYNLQDEDCTNFVSQALLAGGVTQTKAGYGYEQWWYDGKEDPWPFGAIHRSLSWALVTNLSTQLQATGRATGVVLTDMTTKYSGANPAGGDIFMYDWGKGEGYSHLSLSTGREAYYPYTDPNGISYTSITGGSGDSISQHSTDRDHAPWNWGYWTTTLEFRAKYKVKLLKMN